MENRSLNIAKKIWVNICRFLLAIVFIFSGFVKAVDPVGFDYKISDYLHAFGDFSWLPDFVPLLAGIVLSALEFVLGILLLFGIRRKLSSLLTLVFMGIMTPFTLYIALTNPVSDCGCFGDAWVLTNWETFWKNVVLLIAAISVFIWKFSIFRFVSEKTQWLISLYSIIFIIGVSFYCLWSLPILDFRPYKIGKSIPEQMNIPPDAKRSVYESVFILEKDGQKKEFTLENYPDSSWRFIDARTVLREKGYEPPITDFSVMDLESGDDITSQILTDPNYSFLMIAHRIEEADDSNIDLINELYDYCEDYGYDFYCLTSSPDYEIEQWRDRTGAQYPFCLADDITLKTIIRSNPGLVLLKDGVIINKWSRNEIPDEYTLTDSLNKLPIGQLYVKSVFKTLAGLLAWFIIPLMLVIGIDILFVRRREEDRS